MKTFSLLSVLAVAMSTLSWAAPAVNPVDISEKTLRGIATPRQQASIDEHNAAVKKAEKNRTDAIKEAKELTDRNDNGLKKTIQKRHLNTMLPACEREPEAPREPGDRDIVAAAGRAGAGDPPGRGDPRPAREH